MLIELELTAGKFDLVAITPAGDVRRFTLYQSVTLQVAEAVAAEPRLPMLLLALEANPSPAVVAAVATGLQLLQESVMQRVHGAAPVFADDEHTRIQAHEGMFADAVEVLGSERAALAWMGRPAAGLDGHRPVDLLGTVEGAQVVGDFLVRLRFGVYT